MALFTPSAAISEIRGSVGTAVFSRNRYRNIVRNRVTPTNPNTSFQAAARTRMTNAVAAWQALSTANKLAYGVAAENWYTHSTIDGKKPLTGYAYYIKAHITQATYGRGSVSPQFIPRVQPRINVTHFDVQGDRYEFWFDLIGSNSNWFLVCKSQLPVSPGRMSPNESSFTPIDDSPMDVGENFFDYVSAFEVRFGTTLDTFPGDAIFTDMCLLDSINQQLYSVFRAREII